jgi:hypothetical protein
MARQESEREDILREATALVQRIELRLPHEPESVVIGFRRNGCASFFFGGDPVVQFNTAGELRRLFFENELLKAEGHQLIALHRRRTATETALVRQELSSAKQQEILSAVETRVARLQQSLSGDQFELVGEVPANGSVLPQVLAWLAAHLPPWPIAVAPNAV